MTKKAPALVIDIDTQRDTIALFGVTYALSLFRLLGFAGAKPGSLLEVVEHREGTVHLVEHSPLGPIGKVLLRLCNGR